MLNTSLGRWLALSFAASSIASLASTAVAEDDPRDVSRLLPPTTLAYLEIPNPDSIAETILGHPIRARLESMPQYDQVAKSQQYAQAQVGLAMVEGLFGMPLREVVQNTTANGVVAIRDGATDGAAVILTAKDKESAKTVFEKAMQVASIEWFNGLEPVEYRGITAYKKRDVRVAIHEDRILITNNSDLGRFILDQMLEPSGESLHDDPAFQAAKQTQSNEADAWAYVILDPFRSKGKFEKLHRDVRRNPVAEALVGGLLSCLDETPYATAEVDLTTTGLGLQFVIPFVESAIPSEREYYFGPDHAGVGPAIPQQPQQLLSLSTYRDFSAMWLHSGDLFDERINDEFAKADATLTTIFSGHDFGEDILGSVEQESGLLPFAKNSPMDNLFRQSSCPRLRC
ncbi:hypothetical protein [Rhodopirellula sp. MGV]|uniref:hypothetical protein n=1 Tax=Rhodopirellula sp. MGV TaxID=2023130 RepID=UPI000B9788B5|nr:hypothetical protein [Rhodopirellula sp. MGV]OYP31709.1 hypothetical protein CGZ80_20660 [Rhodopirellula sp. MGV]PNY34009.1 hypothetical protein C2E31_25605 [Rhodopirellula baltica]